MVINYYGVKLMTQISNVLMWWKLASILLVIVVFLVTAFGTTRIGSTDISTSLGFASKGPTAIFTAVPTVGITSSYLGFRQGIELACESQNPQRDIPLAIIGSVATYALLHAAKSSSGARGERLRACGSARP
ncbi:MAG: APC family permease [Acidobacteria bacterium]|nr:APC family permease [Acidobacteriota bacterium]